MDFSLNDDQRAFADAVTAWAAANFDLDTVRERCSSQDWGGAVDEVWKAAAELDWLRLCLPEEHGGLGGGWLDLCVLANAWDAALLPGPFSDNVVAARVLGAWGSDAQRSAWIPSVADGSGRLGLALTVSNGPLVADRIRVTVDADGRLSGNCGVVDSWEALDGVIVGALGPNGQVGLWLIDPSSAGVRAEPCAVLDVTTRAAVVALEEVAAEPIPGAGQLEWEQLARGLRAVIAAELVGLGIWLLDLTVAYDIDRKQFGRPVGSFQAVKHRLAEIHVHLTMAEHGWRYASHALDVGLPDADLMACVAKAKASDVGRDATAAMIQFHGGNGFVWEHSAHLFFKRAKRKEFLMGNGDWHREAVAAGVLAVGDNPALIPT